MATLRLLVPAAPAPLGPHRKATLSNGTVTLVFPYLASESDFSDLARDWVEQARPGNHKPLTRPGSPRLARVSLTATFADPADSQASVEPQLQTLRAFAASDQPFVAAFGGLLGDSHWTASGRWVLRDLSIAVQARRHSDNAATRAEAKLELLEANIPGWVPMPSTFRYVSEVPGAGTGRPRSVVVGAGDTLWSIAWDVYGDPTKWVALGDYNGILRPALLTAGTVLLIP